MTENVRGSVLAPTRARDAYISGPTEWGWGVNCLTRFLTNEKQNRWSFVLLLSLQIFMIFTLSTLTYMLEWERLWSLRNMPMILVVLTWKLLQPEFTYSFCILLRKKIFEPRYLQSFFALLWSLFSLQSKLYIPSRLLFEMNVTKAISKNVLVKSLEKTLFFYLYFTWLCGSWKLKRILKNKPFWKYDSWFPSEVSKFTLVRNMLDLSLKYWFMKAKVVFWICYGPKK